MGARAVIFGCSGLLLNADEQAFFRTAQPWGFILFARNVDSPDQLRRLTSDLQESVGRKVPILIDQEGGRVARMRGPHWREWLPANDQCARISNQVARVRSMYLRSRMMANELAAAGINVNCAPVLDLVHDGTHQVIRNRCYGAEPSEVAAIGRAVADGLLAGGVLPVMKHMPGQGRAGCDSHLQLPVVDTPRDLLMKTDFVPFREMADIPMAMTSHVVFRDLDPDRPATQSSTVIDLIRSEIGFDGLLMTDDLSMQALEGNYFERANQSLKAGCDVVLHCNGDAAEMSAVVEAVPELAGKSLARADAAIERVGVRDNVDPEKLAEEFTRLLEDFEVA